MIAAALAERVRDHIACAPSESRRARLIHCLLDWLGVAIAGTTDPAFQIVAGNAGSRPDGTYSLLAAADGVDLPARVFANGFAGHVLDYDDTHLGYWGHPSATVIPVVLAVAEANPMDEERLLAAISAGVEASMLIGLMAGEIHRTAGWHVTATAGIFGAAAAAAIAADVPGERWPDAFRLCAVQAGGLSAAFGSAGKPFQVARAAQLGLDNCRLAYAGLDGPVGIIERPGGFADMHSFVTKALPCPRKAATDGILFKTAPACFGVQAPAIAAQQMVANHDGACPPIAWACVEICEGFLAICTVAEPRNTVEARFSVAFVTALALGGYPISGADALNDDIVINPEVRSMVRRITVKGDAALPASAARLTVLFEGAPSPQILMIDLAATAAEELADERVRLKDKFLLLTAPVIGPERAGLLCDDILNLHCAPDAAGLLRHLIR